MNWEIKIKNGYYWLSHCGKELELNSVYTCNYCSEKIPNHIKLQLCIGAHDECSENWKEYFEEYK